MVLGPVCAKYHALGNEVFWPTWNGTNFYDRFVRKPLWRTVRLYGVDGYSFRAAWSFSVGTLSICQRGSGVSTWFPVKVRQGCVVYLGVQSH